MSTSLLNIYHRWCSLNHQSTFETSYSRNLILHAERERAKNSTSVDTNQDIDIKISLDFFKKKIKNSEWEILKSENLEISSVHREQMQHPVRNCNRLCLSEPKWVHMTFVVKPLKPSKAQEKRRTTHEHASNSQAGKLIIVPTKNSCHLKVHCSLQLISRTLDAL